MGQRAHVVIWLAVVIAACSAGDPRPAEFDAMLQDEVGCTVNYGDSDLYVVGPLGPSDADMIEPNDYTTIRIGRTASDIVVSATVPGGGGDSSTPLNDMPDDGVVARRGFTNGGDPGYVVTCWRGEG